MVRMWISVIIAVVTLGTFVYGQAKPNFSGKWVLVAEKSDFGPMARPDKMTRTITHKDPSVQIATVQSGGATGDTSFEMKFTTDGKPQANTFNGAAMSTTGRWDGATLVFNTSMSSQGMSLTAEDRYAMSDSGKTLTLTRTIAAPDGNVVVRIVFVKN